MSSPPWAPLGARASPQPPPRLLLAALLRGTALACVAAAAGPAATPASASFTSCIVAAGARSFDLAELGGGGAGGAPTLRFVNQEAGDSFGWSYSFAACGELPPPACLGAAPRSAVLQETPGICYGLGAAASRAVAAAANGVVLTFSGGNGGRSTVITVECADMPLPEFVLVNETAPLTYKALVRARAGCARECARDASTGAVCGGHSRGSCAAAGDAHGPVHCVCAEGHTGAACADPVRRGTASLHVPALDAIWGGGGVLTIATIATAVYSRYACGHEKQQAMKRMAVLSAVVCLFLMTASSPVSLHPFSTTTIRPKLAIPTHNLACPPLPPLFVIYGDTEKIWGALNLKEVITIARALKAQYGWREYIPRVSNPRETAELMEANLLIDFGRAPDVLLIFHMNVNELIILDRMNYPRVLLNETRYISMFDDLPLHPGSLWSSLADADLHLPTYEYLMIRLPPVSRHVPRIWMPHSTLPQYELPFNTEPRNVVLLAGAADANNYPLRAVIQKRIDLGDTRFERFSFPGSSPGRSFDHVAKFAAAVHTYIAAIFCGSKHHFLVAKVMEVTATGALLLFSDDLSDALEALGFVDGVHWVSYNASSLDAVVDWVLDPRNRARVDTVRAAGQALSHARHRTDARVDAIHAAALELARAKREGDVPNLDSVRRFPNYADWKRKDTRSAAYYEGRSIYFH